MTVGLNPSYQHTRNNANRSLAIHLYPDHLYNVSPGFDQEEEEYDTFVLSIGHIAEESSEISDTAAKDGENERFSASAEDSEPQRLPTLGRKRKKKRKHNEHQHGAGSATEEGEGGLSSGPQTRSRSNIPKTPHSCTDYLKDKKRSKKGPKSPFQHKHTSKDCYTDTSKKGSKRDPKKASQNGKQADKDRDNTDRLMTTLPCHIFPDSSSDKCVIKSKNKGRDQQVREEEKRNRKKKRKNTKHSAKQEGRGGEEPVTGTSKKRKRKDDTKSKGGQHSGSKGEDPLPDPPKKKYEWIINLFKRKTKPAKLSDDSKEAPASSQKRKR